MLEIPKPEWGSFVATPCQPQVILSLRWPNCTMDWRMTLKRPRMSLHILCRPPLLECSPTCTLLCGEEPLQISKACTTFDPQGSTTLPANTHQVPSHVCGNTKCSALQSLRPLPHSAMRVPRKATTSHAVASDRQYYSSTSHDVKLCSYLPSNRNATAWPLVSGPSRNLCGPTSTYAILEEGGPRGIIKLKTPQGGLGTPPFPLS